MVILSDSLSDLQSLEDCSHVDGYVIYSRHAKLSVPRGPQSSHVLFGYPPIIGKEKANALVKAATTGAH